MMVLISFVYSYLVLRLNFSCRELGDIHISAREGAIDDVKKHLAAGVQVNIRGLCL
jgi:hypothetical protein